MRYLCITIPTAVSLTKSTCHLEEYSSYHSKKSKGYIAGLKVHMHACNLSR